MKLRDLIREERSETFDLFLKKDLIQMPRNYSAKIIGGSSALNKLEDALVKWDAQYRKNHSYKDGDIEKFARKFVGDAGINKAKKWFADDDENLKEGRMNIRGVKNVEKSLGQGSADSTYFAMNKLGYAGYPNSPDHPDVVDFMITKRMYDGTIKIIMKDTMAKDPKVQAELQRLKK